MITRVHQKSDAYSEALYSSCERYRYMLTRTWDTLGRKALFIMLNPSTATELQNDPTVERCERRARTLGFGAFRVTNIFAWRDTDPRKMRAAVDPIGPENDRTIIQSCVWAIKSSPLGGPMGPIKTVVLRSLCCCMTAGCQSFILV